MSLYISAPLDVGLAADRTVLLAEVRALGYADVAADALSVFYDAPTSLHTAPTVSDGDADDQFSVIDGKYGDLLVHTWTRDDAFRIAEAIADRFRIETIVRQPDHFPFYFTPR